MLVDRVIVRVIHQYVIEIRLELVKSETAFAIGIHTVEGRTVELKINHDGVGGRVTPDDADLPNHSPVVLGKRNSREEED